MDTTDIKPQGQYGHPGLGTPLASPRPLAARGKRGKLTLSPRQQLRRRNDTAVLVPQPPAQLCSKHRAQRRFPLPAYLPGRHSPAGQSPHF